MCDENKWLTRVHERNEGGEWREVRVRGKNDDRVAVLLDSRLQSVEELREKRAAATENQPVRFDSPSIGHNRAIRQVRLIQKLRQRAEQGRLSIESKTISLVKSVTSQASLVCRLASKISSSASSPFVSGNMYQVFVFIFRCFSSC